MSTRGMAGVAAGNKVKASFNRWDSYPSGLGVEILAQARQIADDLPAAREQFERLQAVDVEADPTIEQQRVLLVEHPAPVHDDRDWDPESKLTQVERYDKAQDATERWTVLLDYR